MGKLTNTPFILAGYQSAIEWQARKEQALLKLAATLGPSVAHRIGEIEDEIDHREALYARAEGAPTPSISHQIAAIESVTRDIQMGWL
jgi:hypothetical protein